MIPDIYSHRAAVAYAEAHPRRTIPKFGPYLLLQTLGEGEFGKVKLGLHSQWGEEVAVKLIRRGHVDITAARMGKVEREIEVLRTLKHPNIVRLYDVIETDKYIGIILEYAAGGELFDYILAHRYLKERDAARLFAQLISGVWYIHQKKIVHRDLKLENLLLDRQRNVIITDFGFANRFEHRSDDLMQTSCGSPCYAAPELVISEGLYVGSAVDVWSCGVILYAMLAGYLPFDDDPANPDGDNINLLYKYIVNTPLAFPDYISESARQLLGIMLVPDPKGRATLANVMRDQWLSAYAGDVPELEGMATEDGGRAFGKTVEELERAAMEQHQQKRIAYQKQMRAAAQEQQPASSTRQHPPVSQSGHMSMQIQPTPPVGRSQSQQPTTYNASPEPRTRSAQPEFLYESSSPADVSMTPVYPVASPSNKRGNSMTVTSAGPTDSEDPIKMSSTTVKRPREQAVEEGEKEKKPKKEEAAGSSTLAPDSAKDRKDAFRHTIQVEYDSQPSAKRERAASHNAQPARQNGTKAKPLPEAPTPEPKVAKAHAPSSYQQPRMPSETSTPAPIPSPKPQPTPPRSQTVPIPAPTPIVNINKPSPPASPETSRHKKGGSISGSIHRIFGNGAETSPASSRVPSESSTKETASYNKDGSVGRASTLQPPSVSVHSSSETNGKDKDKKGRRNTLTVMVEGFSKSTRSRKAKTSTGPVEEEKASVPPSAAPETETFVPPLDMPPAGPPSTRTLPASTTKANRVMQWFRSRSKGRESITVVNSAAPPPPPPANDRPGPSVHAATISSRRPSATPAEPTTPNMFSRFRGTVAVTPSSRADLPLEKRLRIHHGAVDQTMVTTGKPPVVMDRIKEVLQDMGIEVQLESEFKYRCVRAKRQKVDGAEVAAVTVIGSAASNGVDKRGLPVPSSFHGTGGMLRGLLMRRQSSQVSNGSQPSLEDPPAASSDLGDEVRFSVELTRIDRLEGTYSLDIRRLKGNLRSYKVLYDTIREKADLQQMR